MIAEVKHIKHHDIDFKKWDQTILASKTPLVFAQSFYLNATCNGWEALIMGDYESVMPLTVKSKFGFSYLPQPPFTSQLGIFGNVDAHIVNAFYQYVDSRFNLIEIELNSSNILQDKALTSKSTYVLNYENGIHFNQNTKRNIAKANALGLKVLPVDFIEEILLLSQKIVTPMLQQKVGLSLSTISILDNLILSAFNNNSLVSFKVVDESLNVKAIAHFIYNGKHALYLKGAADNTDEQTGSMHLVIAHAIGYFSDKSTVFDFGGGNQKGLANFYLGFGGQELTYSYFQKNKLPFFIKWFKD